MKELNVNVHKKNERYEAIVRASFDTFIEKGFHNARMEEIAQKAGIGKGTIYEYFPSKKELFCAMVKKTMTWYYESIETAINSGKSFREKLDNMMKLHMEFTRHTKKLLKLLNHNFIYISPELNYWMVDARRQILQTVEGVFRQGICEGEIRQIDVHLVAMIFMASWREIIFEDAFRGEQRDSLEDIKNEALGILLNGIARQTM